MLMADIGVVVIGRNEGERLGACLASVRSQAGAIVYVDSGSTDGSVKLAGELGAEVVILDLRRPFTAARARNAGFAELRVRWPAIRWVQFVDGDCEVVAGWLAHACAFLASHSEVAAVCGRRRERYPERSVYNQLCDLEWDTPAGEARACGGDVMLRADVLGQVGGYREDLIAGEEPELCVRLRAAGWKVWRMPAEMTLHDAAMTHFSQWWWRSVRAGHAFAQGAHLHGAAPERHWVRETRRACVWGLALPVGIMAAASAFGPWAMLLLTAYPLQVARLALRFPGVLRVRALRAVFLVLGKFPEAIGFLRFHGQRLTGRAAPLIEYK
jgi:GT2 family glycosyltransferase